MTSFRLRHWAVRTKLLALLAIPVGGLFVFGATAYQTLRVLRVNGPVYQRVIDGKDLIADVLPPPEYIIETYLALFQAIDETHHADARAHFIDRTRKLRETFESRREFWRGKLPTGELRTALLDEAGAAAEQFFAIEEEQFIPALVRDDRAEAHRLVYGPLAQAYDHHRRAIDRVVMLARAENGMEERAAESSTLRRSAMMILTGVLTLIFTAWTGMLVAWTILRPVRRLDRAITAEARGEGFSRIETSDDDELGRLTRSFNAMADAIEARNAALATSNAELQRANQDLEGFSYSVSHDLRTPLRAMLGFSGAVIDEFGSQVPAEARRFLGIIDQNARRMGLLIDDLLAFARHARLPLHRQALELEPLVRTCFDELAGERQGRHVELKMGPLPPCSADPALMKQVFLNLLSNAQKFTRKCDHAIIEIGSVAGKEGEDTVYWVKDNGAGFDMRYVDKVFVVFQRLHAQEDYEGTGVGLALVQKVISRHGGRVWAEGTPGKGATFYLTIPPPEGAT